MTSWNPFTALDNRGRDDAARHDDSAGRHPLGFSDVRSPETRSETPATDRQPIGFAPASDEAQGYRTEISFRRQPRVLPAPRPIDLGAPATALPVAGRPASDLAATPQPSFGPSPAWTPLAASGDDDKVPFYKREITFRRQKEDGDAVDPVEPEPHEREETVEVERERAPFGFGGGTDEVADPLQPEEEVKQSAAPADDTDVVEDAAVENLAVEDDAEPVMERAPVEEPLQLQPAQEQRVDAEPAAPGDDAGAPDASTASAPPKAKGRRSLRSVPRGTSAGSRSRGRGTRGTRNIVGLKIGASQLAAAVVKETDGRHELVDLARSPLEAGIVVDGEVRDASALANALKAFFDEHKLPKRDVRIGLASNRIGVRTFEMGGVDEENFDNAVRFKAHEVLPVAVHESVLDYRVLDERASETGEAVRRILLVVAPRDQIEPYMAVCQDAGLRLAGIDLEALGLLRAFVEPRSFSSRTADDTATVVVSIGHEVTTLLVAGAGSCEFTRVFDWGGVTLQDAIAQELDVHPAEAATVLRHLALSGASKELASLDEESRGRALDAVRGRLTPFARELVASLQFYQTQQESLGIGEIVITGGTSHLVGLADALHQMIGVSVRVGDPLQRVVTTGGFDPALEASIGSMAIPIGLAIEDDALRTVNLIPQELVASDRRRPSLVKVAAPIAVAVPIAALAFLFVGASGTVSDREGELATVRSQIASLPEPKRPQIDPSLAASEVQRAAALASVLGGRVAWDGVLRDVALVLPSNVSLTQLSAQLPATPLPVPPGTTETTTAALPAAATGVQIDGYTDDQPAVARLLARLRTVPSLTNVQLQSSTKEEVGSNVVVRFVVLADMAGGAS